MHHTDFNLSFKKYFIFAVICIKDITNISRKEPLSKICKIFRVLDFIYYEKEQQVKLVHVWHMHCYRQLYKIFKHDRQWGTYKIYTYNLSQLEIRMSVVFFGLTICSPKFLVLRPQFECCIEDSEEIVEIQLAEMKKEILGTYHKEKTTMINQRNHTGDRYYYWVGEYWRVPHEVASS